MAQLHMCPTNLLEQNLAGKHFIVTGGNSGVGFETTQQLVRQGAHLVLACRRPNEGEKAIAKIRANIPKSSIESRELDLSSLDSVRKFVDGYSRDYSVLHGLINNAGVMNTPLIYTKDGFELQIGTNHLGHFLLTELLLPALEKGAPSRIINLSSCFHDKAMGREGRINFEDMHFKKRKYDGWEAYAQSKLANLLHARHLAKILAGKGISTASVHPGWVRTNLIKFSMPLWVQDFLLRPIFNLSGMIEPWQGAQSTLYTVLTSDLSKNSGSYFSQVGIYRDKNSKAGGWPMHSPNPNAHDDQVASQLYDISRKLVGL